MALVHSTIARLPLQAWQQYNASLERRPLFTKCVTGAVGAALGDVLAQLMMPAASTSGRPEPPGGSSDIGLLSIDGGERGHAGGSGREASSSSEHVHPPMPALGMDCQGQAVHAYHALDWGRTARMMAWSFSTGTPLAHYWFNWLDRTIRPRKPTTPLTACIKVALDQALMSPVGLCVFFGTQRLLEGEPHLTVMDLESKLLPALIAGWSVWPLANLITFSVIPLQQRVLFVNIIAIGYTSYLSKIRAS
mmetsp:Transcript_57822/g.126525  ORF Transcript_57822/g.126525 Transcript_57822/m.126525 type:complete len:249 (-) Transcript_57822:96-842(-)